MTNKQTTPKQPKAKAKEVTKPSEKPQVKRSPKSNTGVATKAKKATNVAKGATEQILEPTIDQLKEQQANLTKQLMYSNLKLVEANATRDRLYKELWDERERSLWGIIKGRVSFTLQSWVHLF